MFIGQIGVRVLMLEDFGMENELVLALEGVGV
jgi:hypothetical protein